MEQAPPTWPAELLQSLARYVFQSENVLCMGDHVSWHAPWTAGTPASSTCSSLRTLS